jgi:hypothetical protein
MSEKKIQTPDEYFASLGKATQELNPGQSPEPNEPTEPVVPQEPQEPAEPVEPQEPTEPNEPNEPVEPQEPQEPDQPTEPQEPEGPIDNWDQVPSEPQEPEVNLYEQLGKELGVENLTKEQVVEALNPKEDAPITGIPDDLALLVNLAKSGVDYKEYISLKNADYSAYDDRTLVEHSVRDAMKDAEGKVSSEAQEQIDQYMEEMTDMDFKIRGNQIRQQLDATKDARLQQIESQSQQISQNREAELKSSLDNFNEVGGFKVQPQHKKSLYDDVSSGDAVADLIHKPDGTYDYDKIVKLRFIRDNFDKMLDYHKQRASTDQKREMINKTANVNTSVNATPPNPDVPKPKDGLDIFVDWAKNLNDPTKPGLFGNNPNQQQQT